MTPKELSSLPELQEYSLEVDSVTHDTVRVRKPLKFIMRKINSDDIILFNDKDGSWEVVYHLEGGPYKKRFSL